MVVPSLFGRLGSASNDLPHAVPEHCGITSPDGYIEPDPDIAGIGVASSFIAIGSLVMILALAKICRYELNDFEFRDLVCPQPPELTAGAERPGFKDARIYLEKQRQKDIELNDDNQRSALSETLFGLGDTQFATGIAIAVAAVAKRDITLYHYLVCDEMAWLAIISSTAGLLTSRKLLENPGSVKKPVRILLMWVLFCLVVWLEVRRNDALGFAESVYDSDRFWDMSDADATVSLILLIFSTASVIIDTIALFPETGLLLYYFVDSYIIWLAPPNPMAGWSVVRGRQELHNTRSVKGSSLRKFFSQVFFFIFVVFGWVPFWIINITWYWFLFQPLMTHIANIFFFIWGVFSVFLWREKGRNCMKPEEVGEEDQFGFGQVVALTLLISPVISNVDFWIESMRRHMTNRLISRMSTMDAISRPQEQMNSHESDKIPIAETDKASSS